MAKRIQVGGRIESKEVGGIVTGAVEILDDAKGKNQSVINQETDDELVRLDQSKQDNLTFDNAPTEGSDNPVKSGGLYTAQQAILLAIAAINELIPSAASVLNKLADKAFVNSSISTNTATFRGTSAAGLNEQQFLAWANGLEHDLNDYVFWQTSDAAGNTLFKRYKWNGTEWAYEYTLNNSTFTAEQWEAIQSGITALLVAKLRALPTAEQLIQSFDSKQNVLTFDNVPTLGSTNPVKSSGIYNAIDGEKERAENAEQGLSDLIDTIQALIPAEATAQNQLADKTDVAAKIVAAIPSWKGQYDALTDLQAVTGAKAGDMGCVKTTDSDGHAVLTFYQYSAQGAWVEYYTLRHYAQNKPATTGTTGDYPYNGMGRIELQKNIVNGVNTLTQAMLTQQNTIYVIQYDFTIGEDITVPANCILEFDGGSIDGTNNTYTITGNNTVISYNSYNIFKSVGISGTFKNDSVVIDIFDDADWSVKMAKSVYISRSINMSKNSSYTQTTTLTMDDKYWGAHINGNGSVITCNTANSIIVNGYVQFVKFEHIFINATVSTGIGMDLQHPSGADYQIRNFNIDNVYLKGFATGIKLNTVRSTTISRIYIDAECCILYTGKSANVFIKDSIFYCNNVSNDNCCGIQSNADGDDYPEGLSVSNVCFYGFAKPLYITDIFVLNVYSCFFDVRMVDGVDTNSMIKIEKNKKILDINITDCWAHNCYVFINHSENVSIENCNFEQCNGSVFHIYGGSKNTKINNCFASTMKQDPTHPFHLVIFNGGMSYNTIISNILMSGFYGIVNSSNNGYNQSNSQLINISGDNNGRNQYSNSKVINCQGYENTPELNEVRRVDGVAKYWDGSAWQAM